VACRVAWTLGDGLLLETVAWVGVGVATEKTISPDRAAWSDRAVTSTPNASAVETPIATKLMVMPQNTSFLNKFIALRYLGCRRLATHQPLQ
jgi:hypothetical protein